MIDDLLFNNNNNRIMNKEEYSITGKDSPKKIKEESSTN